MTKLLFVAIAIIIAVVFFLLVVSASADATKIAWLPIIYYPNVPSPTPTPDPEGVWVYLHNARQEGEEGTKIIGSVPGICYEMRAFKIGKTIYVQAYKDGNCVSAPVPPWPLPGGWEWFYPIYGDIEGVMFDKSAKYACSDYFSDPVNCVEVR